MKKILGSDETMGSEISSDTDDEKGLPMLIRIFINDPLNVKNPGEYLTAIEFLKQNTQ